MKIDSLRLQDFRNYADQTFEFTSDKVFIFGANGIGKTNILEALMVLSLGKSWRETKATDLLLGEAVSSKIQARMGDDLFEVLIEPRARGFFKDGKKITTKDWIGRIPTLLFCPEFLRLFSGGKMDRLAYLDRFVCQVDPHFRSHLLRAVKAHKQKTALLKQLEEASWEDWEAQIHPWNQMLSEVIPILWQGRKAMLEVLEPYLIKAYADIASEKERVGLAFVPSENIACTPKACAEYLKSQREREKASRRNSLSPLRDDVGFYLRDQLLTQSASRGEERSMMLALLSAQKEVLIQHHEAKPILLLDDVFSELDETRQAHLEKLCEGVQTFFTTTHSEHIEGFKGQVQKINLGLLRP